MKSEAITVVVFSRIQLERQFNSWEYGSYTSENSRIFLECLVGQISLKFPGRKVCRQLWRVRIELRKISGQSEQQHSCKLKFPNPALAL